MPLSTDGLRVLVVDDVPENRDVVVDLLDTFGITEVTTSNDVQARTTFRTFRPDVVIVDVAMPTEDGTQIAAWIRRTAPDVRVVLYTAFSNIGSLRLAIDAVGAHAFLQKPFDALDLYNAVVGE